MRKLKLQIQITIDGFIAGPKAEMNWMEWNWDNQLKHYVDDLTEPVDCIILGRKLAEGFIPHWANVAANPDDAEFSSAKKFTDTHKVVFTKTLDKSKWNNAILAKGDLADEIKNLKSQDGGDIIAYGGAQFVSSLIKAGLVEEYHLFINPTAIGNGLPIFSELVDPLRLSLVNSRSFDCGIIVNTYVPKED
jgi:dihydrofolate reductase